MKCRTVGELKKQLMSKINRAMDNEVYQVVVSKERQQVYKVVYDAYDPISYVRRKDNGGLSDVRNMIKTKEVVDGKLIVKNITKPNPQEFGTASDGSFTKNEPMPIDRDLSILIEGGDGASGFHYTYNNGGSYLNPRPFQKATVSALKSSSAHKTALKLGLIKQNIKVK